MDKKQTEEIIKLYQSGESLASIAEKYGTYGNKIRRLLMAEGVCRRSRSEAQALALKTGRIKHPTKGKKRSLEVRTKISESSHRVWNNMTDEQRERRSEIGKRAWNLKSEEEKKELNALANKGFRKSKYEGSKSERYLLDFLVSKNYRVIMHDRELLKDEGCLECDLHIPDIGVVIEIDGNHHRVAIFGEENFELTKSYDKRKDQAITSMGYTLIRVEYNGSSTLYKNNLMCKNIISQINLIEQDKEYFSGKILHQEV
tara:strand:+ start:264 stop:1037 length:774 start_codon:yes stop_codon:yes gene_type:complete